LKAKLFGTPELKTVQLKDDRELALCIGKIPMVSVHARHAGRRPLLLEVQ